MRFDKRVRFLAAVLGFTSYASAQSPTPDPAAPPRGLTIAFVNVDWGDGTIVVGPTGKCLVFDAGGSTKGTTKMIPMLKKLGVKKVDWAIASHYHGDHIGGLDEVILGFPVSAVLDRGTRNANTTWYSYKQYVRAAGAKRRTVQVGQVLDLGGGARVRVIASDGVVLGSSRRHPIDKTANYENSASVVLRVEYGDFSAWLGGDLTGGDGKYDMETPVSRACGDVDVYLADHHGWRDGSNKNLLATLEPEVCVISTGHKNTHNVPHRDLLDRMTPPATNRLVVSTTPGAGEIGFTSGGSMVVTTDGWRYRITDERGGSLDLYTDEYAGNAPRAGDLVISEFHRDPGAFWGEWLEVAHTGASPLNLRGLRVTSATGWFRVATPYRLLPGERLLLCAHGDPSRNGGLPFAHSWPARVVRLHDETDSVRLDFGSVQLDRLSYARGWPGRRSRTAERVSLEGATTAANFATATTRYGANDYGTPGRRNVAEKARSPLEAGVEVLPHSAPGGAALHVFATALSDPGKLSVLAFALDTKPGIKVGSTLIPLRHDALFAFFDGWWPLIGRIPASGRRAVRIEIPRAPGLTGLQAYVAQFFVDPIGAELIPRVSAPTRFRFP